MRFGVGVVLSLVVSPALAAGPHFSVIATLGGAPAIGALGGGTLYGTLPNGGANGAGTLFSLTASGVYTDLHDFVPTTDGDLPNARLAVESDGSIWGTTQSGGPYGGGTLFSYGAKGFSVPHNFGNGTDGSLPLQGPVTGPGRSIIGTAAAGAIGTNGNLWYYGSGTYAVWHNFLSHADGHCPFSGPARGSNSIVYGTTVGRGFGGNPNGSVWQYTGSLKTIHVFRDKADGEWPDQAPVTDASGNIYGTTHVQSGANFAGAIWKISSSGAFSVLHDMAGATDGFAPNSPLIVNADGYLYGTTASGGPSGLGTVFRISPEGAFEVVHSFTGGTDGANPTGSLVSNAEGAIFGATQTGTVFKIVY